MEIGEINLDLRGRIDLQTSKIFLVLTFENGTIKNLIFQLQLFIDYLQGQIGL